MKKNLANDQDLRLLLGRTNNPPPQMLSSHPGAAIAVTLRKGFMTIRKAGHLCVETRTQTYRDYTDREKVMEARTDAIGPGRGGLGINYRLNLYVTLLAIRCDSVPLC